MYQVPKTQTASKDDVIVDMLLVIETGSRGKVVSIAS
jgi:hypothetical protein